MDHSPIFCDDCSSLAMAELDGAFLCMKCLMMAIGPGIDLLSASDVRPLPQRGSEPHSQDRVVGRASSF